MLKPFYQNEADIPENLKGAYTVKNGRYELDELEKDHPVLLKNKELLEKNSTFAADNQRLIGEVATLESKALPKGKVAVDKTEYETLKTAHDTLKTENESYAALGKADEVKSKVEGYEQLKIQAKAMVRDKALMAAGVIDLDKARRFKSYDELEIEVEVKDGKEIFHRVTKDAEGKDSKVVFDGELLKSDGFKDDLGSLVGSGGQKMFRQSTTTTTPGNMAEAHMNKRYQGVPTKT